MIGITFRHGMTPNWAKLFIHHVISVDNHKVGLEFEVRPIAPDASCSVLDIEQVEHLISELQGWVKTYKTPPKPVVVEPKWSGKLS